MGSKLILPGDSAWGEFKLDTKLLDPPEIRLLITPIFNNQIAAANAEMLRGLKPSEIKNAENKLDIEKTLNTRVDMVSRHIIDWDLEDGNGKKIELTQMAKKTGLMRLLYEYVKEEGSEDDQAESEIKAPVYLWQKVLEFGRDFINFPLPSNVS